jgi:uncharacterized protein (DUF433 family)
MDRALRELVWRRAGNCCEYCRMPRRFDDTTVEIDHVHAAMLMQSAGRANVLRALITSERERGPDFVSLAPALTRKLPVRDRGKAMFDRITFDPRILGGRASIRGMRIPVSVIVGQIAHGATRDEVLADYPDLEPEDIQQALSYVAWLAQEEVVTA